MQLQQSVERTGAPPIVKPKIGKQARREEREFYLFISLWIIGFILFDAGPIVASFLVSFTDWSLLSAPKWVGFGNHTKSGPIVRPARAAPDQAGRRLRPAAGPRDCVHPTVYVDGRDVAEEVAGCLHLNTFLKNSLIVTLANVTGNLISCALVAYGFARLRPRGRDVLFLLLLATLMIPREVTIVPRFLLFKQVGMVNTLWPLILPAWFGYPFFLFLLRQFFLSIPQELDEAARIDGAASFRILRSIILPLSKPALATVAVFAFIGNWTNVLDPLIYIRSQDLYTLALGLNLFRGVNLIQFNLLMAVSIVTLLPVLIVFFLSQRLFVEGVTLTGMGGR